MIDTKSVLPLFLPLFAFGNYGALQGETVEEAYARLSAYRSVWETNAWAYVQTVPVVTNKALAEANGLWFADFLKYPDITDTNRLHEIIRAKRYAILHYGGMVGILDNTNAWYAVADYIAHLKDVADPRWIDESYIVVTDVLNDGAVRAEARVRRRGSECPSERIRRIRRGSARRSIRPPPTNPSCAGIWYNTRRLGRWGWNRKEEHAMKRIVRKEPDERRVAKLVKELLVELGEDPERDGLKKTPMRVAKSLAFLTRGYRQNLKAVVNGAKFASGTNHMVILKDIELYSLCEHHMLPFYGKCAIGYISTGKVLGVSKLARIVDMFARRLQIQERMTEEIANAVMEEAQAEGVGVVIRAKHLCMMMRGVEKQNSEMTTSAVLGTFRSDEKVRQEFLSLIA